MSVSELLYSEITTRDLQELCRGIDDVNFGEIKKNVFVNDKKTFSCGFPLKSFL